jgi:hypothetical protein
VPQLQFDLSLLGSSYEVAVNVVQHETASTKTHKAKPVMSKKRDMRGNVTSKRLRRPNVSIVYTAGRAMTKLRAPKPQEARSAWISEKLA